MSLCLTSLNFILEWKVLISYFQKNCQIFTLYLLWHLKPCFVTFSITYLFFLCPKRTVNCFWKWEQQQCYKQVEVGLDIACLFERKRERDSQQREHQWQPQWRVESIFVQPPLLGFINRSALFVSCYCPLRLSVLLFPAPSVHLIPTQFHPTPVYFFCRFRNSKDILYFGFFLVRNAA